MVNVMATEYQSECALGRCDLGGPEMQVNELVKTGRSQNSWEFSGYVISKNLEFSKIIKICGLMTISIAILFIWRALLFF